MCYITSMSEENHVSQPEELKRYIVLTKWIRELTTPALDEIESADRFRAVMARNFARIGELSRINTAILKEHYFPLLEKENLLSEKNREIIRQFSTSLVDPYTLDNLDIFLVHHQLEQMLDDLPEDDDERIRVLDEFVTVSYSTIYTLVCVYPGSDIFKQYREKGVWAARMILEYLEPERFAALKTDKARETVLINSRYICALFQRPDAYGDMEKNDEEISILQRSIGFVDDPFYRAQVPGYDWRYHYYRALEYGAGLGEFNNARGFSREQLEEIYHYSELAVKTYESAPAFFSQIAVINNLNCYHLRNAYLTGRISKEDYKKALAELFKANKATDRGQEDMSPVMVLSEYVLLVDPKNVSAEDAGNLRYFYREVNHIIYRQARRGTLFTLMFYISFLLNHYVVVPGGESFESFCLHLMAALHPPTYVHTLTVSLLSRTMAMHLLNLEPEQFVGMPGYDTLEDVLNHKSEIAEFVYHAALCHDFGKLLIIELIRTYGREFLDMEFKLIQAHTIAGAHVLSQREETAAYADVAEGHQKWFNNKGGYPESFDAENSPYRTAIAIVTCADCLDATTDSIGRSYKEGKNFDSFLKELHEGSGTRYAPFLERLLQEPAVRKDIETELTAGREDNYRKAFHTLKADEE